MLSIRDTCVVLLLAVLPVGACRSCSGGDCAAVAQPSGLLGPRLGLLINGNARGVYLASVQSFTHANEPLPGLQNQGEAGTYARVRIEEVFRQAPPRNDEEDVPLQAPGNELDVQISLDASRECGEAEPNVSEGSKIVMFLWRAKGIRHPNGSKVPGGWLTRSALCVDGNDQVHIHDVGVQERGTVTVSQFRDAMLRPWDEMGFGTNAPDADGGLPVAQACSSVVCGAGSRCFFGAGCWTFTRGGPVPDDCLHGDFFSDGEVCASQTTQFYCD